jgi:hypothetical protein
MSDRTHPARPPDIGALLEALIGFNVRLVVVGSAAAKLYGVDVIPRDLDIVPDVEPANLVRLAAALRSLEASRSETDRLGGWQLREDGEWFWASREATEAEKQALLTGELIADDLTTLDHHFQTKHGNLDIVPRVAGEYSVLLARAKTIVCRGIGVNVAHPDDLLATLTIPRRAKDAERVRELRKVQRRAATA